MALTGPRLVANVYSRNGNTLETRGVQNGRLNEIPFGPGVLFYAPNPNETAGSVTIGSIIEILPQGLNQLSVKLGCVETVAQLITNGA